MYIYDVSFGDNGVTNWMAFSNWLVCQNISFEFSPNSTYAFTIKVDKCDNDKWISEKLIKGIPFFRGSLSLREYKK